MRYIIFIMFSFFLLQQLHASFTHEEYVSPRHCSLECDPYNPKNCNDTCTQDECASNEVAWFGQCWTVDCSRTPGNPVLVGNVCQALPKCLPENYEYKNSAGNCVKCQNGVFDNDVCNVCPDGQRYSVQYSQCRNIECAPDYEYKDGMCQLKECPFGENRDKYGVCVKKPTVPISCPPDHVLSDGKCVLVQKPIETDCSTIDGSVECMTDSIVGAADTLNNSLYSKLKDVLDLFTSLSDGLDKLSPNSSGSQDQDKEVDTSALAADVPFHEIQKSDISDSLFTSRAQCPPDRIFTSWNSSYHFSYQKICDVLQKLSYIVMLLGFVTSINIIVRD